MPAIADIIIKRPPSEVWGVIANASSHPHWLSKDITTTYQGGGELAEGMKFTRFNKETGVRTEGQVVALKAAHFLKVRFDAPQEAFATTEYHLIAVAEGCALRVLGEVYDSSDAHYYYFPEMMEQQWRGQLERLKRYCEAVSKGRALWRVPSRLLRRARRGG